MKKLEKTLKWTKVITQEHRKEKQPCPLGYNSWPLTRSAIKPCFPTRSIFLQPHLFYILPVSYALSNVLRFVFPLFFHRVR